MKKNRYRNLDNVENTSTWSDLRRWQKERKTKVKDLSYIVPLAKSIETPYLQTNRIDPTITWIGHSTFFIQLSGLNLLVDPVWANRMGFQNRLAPAGIPIEDLPEIDIVLISHGHYDHLHFGSIQKLKGRPLFLIPIGLGKTFKRHGLFHFQEFEWWQSYTNSNIHITFVPAQHWTRRTLFDTNTSLWGGWVMGISQDQESELTIYFVGDTGYFRGFKEIGDQYQIDYVLMPIGAYEPEWFMSKQHVTPEEAIQGFIDCKANFFVPMHYGAFRLADDTPQEALDRLYAEWRRRELDHQKLIELARGETLRL